jgi:hypothetical protein
MNSLKSHNGDDELLMVLMDAPSRWLVKHGVQSAPATSLRQALCKAHEFSSKGDSSCCIVKQPNDEMVVEAHQITRLLKQLDLPS